MSGADASAEMEIFMKTERQRKILELIKKDEIGTQEELASALEAAGFNVTQATVSRDIRELNLTKTTIDGKQKYVVYHSHAPHMSDKFIRVLKEGFVAMDMAQNILVIKTVAGMAMAVCAAIDSMHWHEVVGSIAGDDTIMVAVRSVDDTVKLMGKLKKILSE